MSSLDTDADNRNGTESPSDTTPAELTQFQLNCLFVLAERPRKGLAIKDVLSEELYQKDVNHGRLYPNLDTLREKGLIDKRERDGRTNEYAISAKGRRLLAEHLAWELEKVGARPDTKIAVSNAVLGGEE